MFEKEAEEIMMQKVIKENDCIMTPCKTLEDCQLYDFCFDDMVAAFKDGAEFGYNKANEWHKYSERPKKKINALCLDTEQNRLILGFYDLEADEWVRYGGYETIHIDLWKEIVLPELKKSE